MEAVSDEPGAIVAICRGCSRLVFAAVDNPIHAKENAREVAKMVRAGFRIENWPTQKVREADWICECPTQKKTKAKRHA